MIKRKVGIIIVLSLSLACTYKVNASAIENSKTNEEIEVTCPPPYDYYFNYKGEYETDGIIYRDNGDGTVSVVGCNDKFKSTVVIPVDVKVYNKIYPVSAIEEKAFYENKTISKLVMNLGPVKIGAKAFYGCDNLEKVQIGGSVRSIGEKAFAQGEQGKLKDVVIPLSVRELAADAFCGPNMQDINVKEKNPFFKDNEGVVFSKDGSKLINFPKAHKNYTYANYYFDNNFYSIPEKTKVITDGVFDNCTVITGLYIPDSVEQGLDSIKNLADKDTSINCIWASKDMLEKVRSSSRKINYIECNIYDRDSYINGMDPIKIKADSGIAYEMVDGSYNKVQLEKDDEGYLVYDLNGNAGEEKYYCFEVKVGDKTFTSQEITVNFVSKEDLQSEGNMDGINYMKNEDGTLTNLFSNY